jgi:hypothetical protein
LELFPEKVPYLQPGMLMNPIEKDHSSESKQPKTEATEQK